MIRAIDTEYQGYRFRSRLEARWAVFFDLIGVAWEYEPEGFDLGADGFYLPDFWLPDFEDYIEVKPFREPTEQETRRAIALSGGDRAVAIVCGDPMDHRGMLFMDGKRYFSLAERAFEDWPVLGFNTKQWVIYFQIDRSRAPDHFKEAKIARSARFEHGQTPKLKRTTGGERQAIRDKYIAQIRKMLEEKKAIGEGEYGRLD